MYKGHHITVIVPALNESLAIQSVVTELEYLTSDLSGSENKKIIDIISVCDNGSDDDTSERAEKAGAHVVSFEPEKGYGAACLMAISKIEDTDVLVFVNGDHSEDITQLSELLDELIINNRDLVIGSRVLGKINSGALLPQQIFGNRLAAFLIRKFWSVECSDIGPFRAIRFEKYKQLKMQDRNYGWTIEMQVKAIRYDLNVKEIPVNALVGMSASTISGTLKGTFGAAYKILGTIIIYGLLDNFSIKKN